MAELNNVYTSICRVPIFLVLVYKVSNDVHLELLNHPLVVASSHVTDVSSTLDKLPPLLIVSSHYLSLYSL